MREFEKIGEAVADLAAQLAPPVLRAEDPAGNGTVLVVRNGYGVQHVAGRSEWARRHEFHDLRSFADWMNRHADPAVAEVLAAETRVRATLAGRDLDGDVVSCELQYHPLFDAWLKVLGKPLAQQGLQAHVRSLVQTIAAGDVLLDGVQRIQVIAGGELTAELDEKGFYRYHGDTNKTQVEGRLPSTFRISVPIFIGVPDTMYSDSSGHDRLYELDVLLSIQVQEKPLFTLTAPGLPIVLHAARLDAVEYLRTLLHGGFLVGLGELKQERVLLHAK